MQPEEETYETGVREEDLYETYSGEKDAIERIKFIKKQMAEV